MKVTELNEEDFNSLKVDYLFELQEGKFGRISWSDIINCDEIVSDKEVIDYYSCVEFTEEDFH